MAEGFTEKFQRLILSSLLRDPSLVLYGEFIKPNFFENRYLAAIWAAVKPRTNTTKRPIQIEVASDLILQFLEQRNYKDRDRFFVELDKLYKMDLGDSDYVLERLIKFGKTQAIKTVLQNKFEEVKQGKFDSFIDSMIKEVGKVDQHLLLDICEYFNEEEIKKRYQKEAISQSVVSTGIPMLDRYLGGGLDIGELGAILAPAGVGKSAFLTALGCNALRNRKKVLHISCEISKIKTARRYDMNLLGKPKDYLFSHPKKVRKFLTQFHRILKSNLLIQFYPTKTATVSTIDSLLMMLKTTKDFQPDLVIIDYAAILKPTFINASRPDLMIGDIFERTRGLSAKYQTRIWTAAQTNRQGLSKEVVTLADLGESWEQAKISDVVLALCQTDEEYANDAMRIFGAKNRDNAKNFIIPLFVDLSTMTFKEDILDGDMI